MRRRNLRVLCLCLGLTMGAAGVGYDSPVRPPRALLVEGPLGFGSGFLVEDDLVVTEAHVARMPGPPVVDGVPAQVVAVDEANDLALLRLTRPIPGPVALLRDMLVGEPLTARGHLGEVRDEVETHGRGSGWLHEGPGLPAPLYDGGVQPGMSGGPVVGEDGLVVGSVSRAVGWGPYPNPNVGVLSPSQGIRSLVSRYRAGDPLVRPQLPVEPSGDVLAF